MALPSSATARARYKRPLPLASSVGLMVLKLIYILRLYLHLDSYLGKEQIITLVRSMTAQLKTLYPGIDGDYMSRSTQTKGIDFSCWVFTAASPPGHLVMKWMRYDLSHRLRAYTPRMWCKMRHPSLWAFPPFQELIVSVLMSKCPEKTKQSEPDGYKAKPVGAALCQQPQGRDAGLRMINHTTILARTGSIYSEETSTI
ncbi:hypothetical protein RRG08_038426 [Elysia crispata]|uniref:Uncharacterized protein n=1 Tax=Elysia crispata TaxID=231223 RepID=A0AAE1AMM0_9GAST|nr:hypothetical protein RRG08_038426 [Elysia crispata]